jgi:nucleoside-diphosphate-sugar epimerase
MKSFESDLEYICQNVGRDISLLKDANIFITGGTGFIGKSLLESIIYFNEKYNINANVTVLSRNSQPFTIEFPYIAINKAIKFLTGDIRDFNFPEGRYNYIIHGATEASAKMNVENPLLMADVIVNGTRHVLDFALKCKAKKVLFISSGAVYGKQPDDLAGFTEDYTGAPDPLDPGAAYAESKRMAEFLCATFARIHRLQTTIARCFAFVGPHLSLDKHFAIGNFINDGINKRDIIISGNGKPKRSYMYSTDLIIWLWTILLRGNSGEAYNVGSDRAITIEELAKKIAGSFPGINVKTLNQIKVTDRNQNYIPNIQKARGQFNFTSFIELDEAIFKTIQYHTKK